MSSLAVFRVLGDATASAATKIGSDEIKANAITSGKIKKEAVVANKIKGAAVTSAKLADGAVSTAKLGEGVVTASRLAKSPFTLGSSKSAPVGVSDEELECPAGTRMLAGGAINSGGNDDLLLSGSHPNNENKWRVQLSNTSAGTIGYTMVVTCIKA